MEQSTASLVSLASVHRFDNPSWLLAKRNAAFDLYQTMPTPKLEKTDLSRREWVLPTFVDEAMPSQDERIQNILTGLPSGSAVVEVQDGIVKSVTVPETLVQAGVIVSDLESASSAHQAVVEKYWSTVVPAEENKWTAFNAALFRGGLFVYIPKHVVLNDPIVFLNVSTKHGNGSAPRVLVVAEDQSSVPVVAMSFDTDIAAGVYSEVVEIVAKAGARVTYTAFEELLAGPTHYVTRRAQVGQDARVDWIAGDVGDGFTVSLLESVLRGTGSQSSVRVIGFGYGRQRTDMTASMVHEGRHSESEILMQGVLRERANSLFRSSTHIVKGAAAAGSEQSDRMLLLTETARADAIPMLLIDENDVQRCGHAASVGKIDPNHIYYLMSRGIPASVATRMIVWGYLQPTVDAIPLESARSVVSALIDRELMK